MKNILIVILLTFSSSILAQTLIGSKEDINAILKSKKEFSMNFINGNINKIVERYTTDAKLFPNDSKIIEGYENISNQYTMPKNVKIISHKISPTEIKIVNENAYAYGTYEGITLMPEGERTSWKGKYVNVWKKVNGKWKVYLEIWNSTPL
jgi:ketosteroid isomerase-like protein